MDKPLRILIGGSPCTYWSIAQAVGKREVEASGQGWELFKNYLIAKEKFHPDYFLYENNKSASQAIKDQIAHELNVELQYINSSLVSAQNRQRFYAHNIPNVKQPEDRNLKLIDLLEENTEEKGYKLKHIINRVGDIKDDVVRIGDTGTNGQANRVYSPIGKSITLCANGGGGGAKTGLYLCPKAFPIGDSNEKAYCLDANYYKGSNITITLTRNKRTLVASILNNELKNAINDEDGNLIFDDKIYYVINNNQIRHNKQSYTINIPNGIYEVRKLTPIECERLQTLPDNYTEGVSNTQRYKCLGNGWTAEVIIHILSNIDYPKDNPIEILSMYDGIATGMYCLDKLGYTNIIYKAYEIDKYAIQIAKKNYPNIIECGDTFQIRNEDWRY